MKLFTATIGMALALLIVPPVSAQTSAQAAEADPGVRPTVMIDRVEVLAGRVELAVGAIRRVHQHDDVVYHLWIPIEGTLQITIGSDAPVTAKSGQAFFIKGGTPHGFRNIGTTPGAALEILIKQTTTAGGPDPVDVLAAVLRDVHIVR
jgi:mannose-6-phosphate isomerase-like protein (cupin superfamily)